VKNKTLKKYMNFSAVISTLIPLFFIALLMHLTGFFESNYDEYREQFTIEFVGVNDLDNSDKVAITYRVTNASWRDWEWINYQVLHKNNDKTIYSSNSIITDWKINAGEKALLTIEVEQLPNITAYELTVQDLRNSRKFSL